MDDWYIEIHVFVQCFDWIVTLNTARVKKKLVIERNRLETILFVQCLEVEFKTSDFIHQIYMDYLKLINWKLKRKKYYSHYFEFHVKYNQQEYYWSLWFWITGVKNNNQIFNINRTGNYWINCESNIFQMKVSRGKLIFYHYFSTLFFSWFLIERKVIFLLSIAQLEIGEKIVSIYWISAVKFK